MSVTPIITFKAGICDMETQPTNITAKPQETPGYIYLYSEDDLIHFCWRPRNAPPTEPELDLVMVPSDGTFTPYRPDGKSINGRIYVLKFSSSSQRYLFWLQSKSQDDEADPTFWSERDLKLGWIVNKLLQGEDVDVETEVANIPRSQGPSNGDDDETMEDVEGVDHDTNHGHGGSGSGGGGGAGPDATGGDVREEGQESREGGADGGRAATSASNPSSVVQDFLRSLGGNQSQAADQPFTTLQDLLPPSTTLPFLDTLDAAGVDNLLKFLPQELLTLALQIEDPTAQRRNESAQDLSTALSLSQKKNILRRVLHSPQFSQSLASLTVAIRDGGLPSISEALQIPVENGGFLRRGGVPLGGGDAVKAFIQGVRDHVKGSALGHQMETD
ncbi:proteasome complex subunit Rpn13 ubiquitin receptor-domain-containing protein [Aspergillus crustosus]